jgi:predicted nucleotidyltransferase
MDDKMREQISEAAAALREAGAKEVYLFGSAATGKLRENSDIDLAVSGLPPRIFFRAMADAADFLDRPLMLVDLDEDNAFTRCLRERGGLQRVDQTAPRRPSRSLPGREEIDPCAQQ